MADSLALKLQPLIAWFCFMFFVLCSLLFFPLNLCYNAARDRGIEKEMKVEVEMEMIEKEKGEGKDGFPVFPSHPFLR